MIAYLTPNSGGGVYLCRRFRFRAELAPMILGQIEELLYTGSWEQSGDLTVEDMIGFVTEAINDYLDAGDRCMIGTSFMYFTATPPDGALPLDGSSYDVFDYPDLVASLDDQYINPDGTFTLPDMRGRVPLGAGAGVGLSSYALGDLVGVENHQLTIDEIPAHSHDYASPTADILVVAPGEAPGSSGVGAPLVTGLSGGGVAHENRQPSYAVNFAIWYR